jgi:hypothetical protein
LEFKKIPKSQEESNGQLQDYDATATPSTPDTVAVAVKLVDIHIETSIGIEVNIRNEELLI